jgi:NAD(P)H-hydrate repair Nnr-like enzyme with NAD(P)H-hydrate dehydratase domain
MSVADGVESGAPHASRDHDRYVSAPHAGESASLLACEAEQRTRFSWGRSDDTAFYW